MLDTLFHLPHQLAGIPLFGIGWVLAIWLVIAAGMLAWPVYRGARWSEVVGNLPLLLIVAAVIIWVLPQIEVRGADKLPLGLPIRGFGTMVMIGALLGITLGVRRTRQMGGDAEQFSAVAFVVLVAGFAGARAFYVVQYFDDFRRPTLVATVQQILNFTEGGMVVYGSIVAGFLGGILYAARHKMPILPYCDIATPCLAIGMAIGRIGCFCHGCCFSGACEPGICSVQFPQGSPPYWHQFRRGQLHGITISRNASGRAVVGEVAPGSEAERARLPVGAIIAKIQDRPVADWDDAQLDPFSDFRPEFTLVTEEGQEYRWAVSQLPARSLPVHPIQLYSFVSSLLMFLTLWSYYPLRSRDGEVLGLMMLMYPIARAIEEVIRDDEAGKFGTVLTISQWISLLTLLGAGLYWIWLLRQPPGIRMPISAKSGTFSAG